MREIDMSGVKSALGEEMGLERARAERARIRERPVVRFECPKEFGCWVEIIDAPSAQAGCRHGVMRKAR